MVRSADAPAISPLHPGRVTWYLDHDGHRYAVRPGGSRREAVFLVDREVCETQTADYWSAVTFEVDPGAVRVAWGPRNTLTSVRLERPGNDGALDFVPPPGSRAARREALRRDHPVRFTFTRMAIAVVQVIVGILGVSSLLTALLPRVDLSWLPRPDLPSIDPPDWLRYVDPVYWLSRLPWPDVPDLLSWVPDWVGESTIYWLPVLIALVAARAEIRRRRLQDRERGGAGSEE